MEPITFPDFMNEENMRKMSRDELVNLFLMMGQAMLPSGGAEMPDPLTLPIAGERMTVPTRDGEVRCILYCAQRTLGSHARIVNAARFGNLSVTTPQEFIKKK